MVFDPFLKVTVPVGVPPTPPVFVTVAVNVTAFPVSEGFALVAIAVAVVDAGFVVMVSVQEVNETTSLELSSYTYKDQSPLAWVPVSTNADLNVDVPRACS